VFGLLWGQGNWTLNMRFIMISGMAPEREKVMKAQPDGHHVYERAQFRMLFS